MTNLALAPQPDKLQPSIELATAVVNQIFDDCDDDPETLDDVARALTTLVTVMADEQHAGIRKMFARDLVKAIYSRSSKFEVSAAKFAANARRQFAAA